MILPLKATVFVINTPFGEVLTRDGHFKTDASRRLLTTEGYPVQGFNGDIIIEDTDIATNEFGEIIYGNEIIDKFQLVDVTNKGDLVKNGRRLLPHERGAGWRNEGF